MVRFCGKRIILSLVLLGFPSVDNDFHFPAWEFYVLHGSWLPFIHILYMHRCIVTREILEALPS